MDTKRLKVDKGWLVGALLDRDLQKQDLAHALGLSPSGVSKILNNSRAVSLTECGMIAKFLNEPMPDVAARFGIKLPPHLMTTRVSNSQVGIVGWINAQGEVLEDGLMGPRVMDKPAGLPEKLVGLRHQCEDWRDGSVMLYTPTDRIEPDAVGKLAVVGVGSQTLVRVLKKGYSAGEWRLIGLDKSETSAQVNWAALVVWWKQ